MSLVPVAFQKSAVNTYNSDVTDLYKYSLTVQYATFLVVTTIYVEHVLIVTNVLLVEYSFFSHVKSHQAGFTLIRV